MAKKSAAAVADKPVEEKSTVRTVTRTLKDGTVKTWQVDYGNRKPSERRPNAVVAAELEEKLVEYKAKADAFIKKTEERIAKLRAASGDPTAAVERALKQVTTADDIAKFEKMLADAKAALGAPAVPSFLQVATVNVEDINEDEEAEELEDEE